MEQLTEFTSNHLYLSIGFVILLGLLLNSLFGSLMHGVKSVSPTEATLLINRENAQVLDIREISEAKSGYILNSIQIPFAKLQERINELEKYKDTTLIVTGNHGPKACSLLKKQGFSQLRNLAGGVMAWQNANLPLGKKTS